MKKKLVLTVLSVAMVAALAVGGTLAYLTAKTDAVTNTFTIGNIDLGLTETPNTDTDGDGTPDAWQAKMIPGTVYSKDPTVTVTKGSEACWLFVKVEKSADFDTYVNYTIGNGWTALPGVDGVYYREVSADAENDQNFNVLAGDNDHPNGVVTVKPEVTALPDGMDELSLTFTAYAVQKDNLDVTAAWTQAAALA